MWYAQWCGVRKRLAPGRRCDAATALQLVSPCWVRWVSDTWRSGGPGIVGGSEGLWGTVRSQLVSDDLRKWWSIGLCWLGWRPSGNAPGERALSQWLQKLPFSGWLEVKSRKLPFEQFFHSTLLWQWTKQRMRALQNSTVPYSTVKYNNKGNSLSVIGLYSKTLLAEINFLWLKEIIKLNGVAVHCSLV